VIGVTDLTAQLLDLGIAPGSVVLVHTAFSKVGPVEDGPHGVVRALARALGPDGTLVMPSMSDDDDHPFDPKTTACRGMGVMADTFWRLPGVMRSDNPHGFAAMGREAARITAGHPLDFPHGPNSPVGRVHELDGRILLLGAGHDANTTIHLAEAMAGVRYRRKKSLTILRDGLPVQFRYEEIDHCCDNFNLVDGWLDAEAKQRRGRVGRAEGRLMKARDDVAFVVARLKADETTFLHEMGVDDQCDEARARIGLHP